jgi:AcrR family transcriptional regulator
MPELRATEDCTHPAASHCCDNAKRQQIMEGARQVFLQDGFDGASIGDIVRAAGVSKGTVYAYFPSKEALFEAMMVEDRRKQAEALFTIDENNRDVAAVLRRLGESFVEMLYEPQSLELLRIVIAAASKFPRIGKAFFDEGPCRGSRRLGAYLERMTELGVLRVDHPELAARQFLDLCKTSIHLRLLLGDREPPKREEVERNLDSAVKVFLAAYGAGGAAASR